MNQTKLNDANEERSSNFELLRILSMLAIVASHYATKSGFSSDMIKADCLWLQILQQLSSIAVDVFILISAYFLVNSHIKLRKAINLIIVTTFYSIVLFVVSFLCNGGFGNPEMSKRLFLKELISSALPINSGLYWFITDYLCIYVISPFLNIVIKSVSERAHKWIIIVGIIVWSLIPTIIPEADSGMSSNLILWFIVLYFVGAYIRLHQDEINFSKTNQISAFILSITVPLVIRCTHVFSGGGMEQVIGISWNDISLHMVEKNNFFVFMGSVSLFLIFRSVRIHSRFINKIASCTFAVYLLHNNPYFHEYLWMHIFRSTLYERTAWLIPYSIFAILSTYIICIFIELFRKNILFRMAKSLTDMHLKKLDKRINDMEVVINNELYKNN